MRLPLNDLGSFRGCRTGIGGSELQSHKSPSTLKWDALATETDLVEDPLPDDHTLTNFTDGKVSSLEGPEQPDKSHGHGLLKSIKRMVSNRSTPMVAIPIVVEPEQEAFSPRSARRNGFLVTDITMGLGEYLDHFKR